MFLIPGCSRISTVYFAAMFLMIALTGVIGDWRSSSNWIIFLISVVNAYMSHYTLLTILPAMLLLPVLQYLFDRRKRQNLNGYLYPAILIVAPAVIPLIAIPSLGERILSLASSGGGLLTGSTTLSSFFGFLPVLSYLALEFYDDYALIAMFILVVVYLYKALPSITPMLFVPIIWFLSLIIAAPYDTSVGGSHTKSVVPLTLMTSYGLSSLFPNDQLQRKSSMARRKSGNQESVIPRAVLIIIFLGTLLIGSWGQTIIVDSISNSTVASQSQLSVYDSIYWLVSNTPNNSKYLSVSDWRFTYTNLIIGRYESLRVR